MVKALIAADADAIANEHLCCLIRYTRQQGPMNMDPLIRDKPASTLDSSTGSRSISFFKLKLKHCACYQKAATVAVRSTGANSTLALGVGISLPWHM